MQLDQKAVEALRLYDIYDRMPSDRGGKNGPRGRAYQAFVAAKDEALTASPFLPVQGVGGSNLHIVFTGFPGPGNECVFVEVENDAGKSISAGEWKNRPDGLVELVIPAALSALIPAQSQEPARAEAVAWRYRYMNESGVWSEWKPSPVDPNDWTWPATWKDFEASPLYAAPAPEGWRSMDSAPKGTDKQSGPSILLCGGEVSFDSSTFDDRYPNTGVACASWWINERCWVVGNDEGHDQYVRLHNPTHWMPLPAAPLPEEA